MTLPGCQVLTAAAFGLATADAVRVSLPNSRRINAVGVNFGVAAADAGGWITEVAIGSPRFALVRCCTAERPRVPARADGDDALDGPAEATGPELSDSDVSANATAGIEAIAAPTPSATANPPTRPT